jgi:hypothetical protein
MEEQKNLRSLGIIALKGVSIGVGIAIALSAIAGCLYWLESRPRPWRQDAISAAFSGFVSIGEPPTFGFEFTLTNHTGLDYRLDTPPANEGAINPAGIEFGELYHGAMRFPARGRLLYPIFVPANQKAEVVVAFEPQNAKGTTDILGSPGPQKERFKEFMRREESDLGGFALFDPARRYQVTFPKGW